MANTRLEPRREGGEIQSFLKVLILTPPISPLEILQVLGIKEWFVGGSIIDLFILFYKPLPIIGFQISALTNQIVFTESVTFRFFIDGIAS